MVVENGKRGRSKIGLATATTTTTTGFMESATRGGRDVEI